MNKLPTLYKNLMLVKSGSGSSPLSGTRSSPIGVGWGKRFVSPVMS